MNFIESYRIAEAAIREFKPDLFFANADRVEMCGATAAAFHNKVKIAHYQAGVVNDPITTFDDIDRHVITLWADLIFCETFDMADNAENLKFAATVGGKPWEWEGTTLENIHVVGITHLDDLCVDESKVPEEPYDLVLMSNAPLEKKGWNWNKERCEIQIEGNPDGEPEKLIGVDIYYPNLPRPQFLGLLKNCQRFITNSSSAITEAPYFLKPEQIVMVGDRNRNRPPVECKPGGSDRIVKILKEIAENG